jgi:hypothetical protein
MGARVFVNGEFHGVLVISTPRGNDL